MGEDLGGGSPDVQAPRTFESRTWSKKISGKTWIDEFSTPSRVGRRIEEGCALVPPRQFIGTSGGFSKSIPKWNRNRGCAKNCYHIFVLNVDLNMCLILSKLGSKMVQNRGLEGSKIEAWRGSGRLLGASWAAPGSKTPPRRLLDASCAALGPSWAPSGGLLGPLGGEHGSNRAPKMEPKFNKHLC